MSFILDALKKSELERQRQTAPGLVEAGAAHPKAQLPRWAIAACILLAVNLIILSVVLIRGRGATPAEATGAAAPPRAAAAAPEVDHFSPLPAQPTYAPEIPVAASSHNRSETPGAVASPAQPPEHAAAGHAARRADPVLTSDDYKPADEEVLPTINEISLTGQQALPELHLDVHVFATKAADRFVYINMRKYHEGATLQEGPTLERIRRDGVVLDYQGVRFLLPRQ